MVKSSEPNKGNKRSKLFLITGVAFLLFIPLFIVRKVGVVDFWWWLSANIITMIMLSHIIDKTVLSSIIGDLKTRPFRKIGLGLLAALILYGVFYVGNVLSRQMLPFASQGIDNVYGFKQNAHWLRIVLLMSFIIGPGEEIFWRGFLQKHYAMQFTPRWGYILVIVFYTFIHFGSFNSMLILAALVCGICWGWLYWRFDSIVLNMVSHLAWDLAVFVFFPFY